MRPHPFYAILNTVQVRFKNGLFVFLPALDLNVFQFGSAEGFMTRDSRSVERKKPGRPKARRRFQFSKR